MVKLPVVVAKTLYHKGVTRLRGDGYEEHIKRVYSDELFTDDSDKFAKVRQQVTELAWDGGKNRSVVDVATGAGWQALDLALRDFEKIWGVDLEKARIAWCKREHGEERVKFEVMDAAEMEFGNSEVDAVVVSAGLHDLPEKVLAGVIKELTRVARRRVVIFEPRNFSRGSVVGEVYALAGRMFDESIHFRDYVFAPVDRLFDQGGFELEEKRRVWGGLAEVKCYRSVAE